MKTLKTKLHFYRYDVTIPAEREGWEKLRAELSARGPSRHKSCGGKTTHYDFAKSLGTTEIILETKHLFENQWNTENGARLMDWAQDCPPAIAPQFRMGYYLEQTEEMREIRRNTLACGYCGAQQTATADSPKFCGACLGNVYLKEGDLHLLRLQPISERGNRKQITDEERAEILPRYLAAQLELTKQTCAKQTEEVLAEYQSATMERDGKLWLLARNIKLDNVIFYDHTAKFSFGWQTPLAPSVAAKLEPILKDFPYPHEIKKQ